MKTPKAPQARKAPKALKAPKSPKHAGPGRDDVADRASADRERRDDDAMQGEGNYTAARRYDQAATDFANSGRVDDAARRARPAGPDEERALDAAEAEGRSHAKDEDPALSQRHGR